MNTDTPTEKRRINRVQVAAKLYDTRDTMRRFYGDRFDEVTKVYRDAIQREGGDTLAATLAIAERVQKGFPDKPMMTALAIAAGVELIEPAGGEA